MTKRILAALLAAVLLAGFACCAEEEYPVCEFDLEAYGGMLNVTYADGTTEETGGWGFCCEITEEGMTIGSMLAGMEIAAVEAVLEGDAFEGWLVFDVEVTEDEDGFSEYGYTMKSETPITTEELMALPAPQAYTMYAAKWESIPAEEYFQDSGESYETIRIPSATLYANGGVMRMHGGDEDYETDMSVATAEPGQLLGEVLELDTLLSVNWEGHTFTGWSVYDVADMETIEGKPEGDGLFTFEVFNGWYCVLWDYSVLRENASTEDLYDIPCGETDLLICANWE